jgi:hypothetical protein
MTTGDADLLPALLATHAAATMLMTGLDWFVHAVHYPIFARAALAGDDHYRQFQREHLHRTAPLIPPIMLLELGTALALVLLPDQRVDLVLAWAGIALLAVVWVATFAGAVPMHHRLEKGFDAGAHRWLMRFDLVRAVAWTARSALALLMLMQAMSRSPLGLQAGG